VSSSSPCDAQRRSPRVADFVLYVEGPSDCEILRSWARIVSPALSDAVASSAVILGGRRPARAVEHFEGIAVGGAAVRGLCVLDRDEHGPEDGAGAPEGLEFFTWPRRHIESYLLVPTAMRRCMRMSPGDPRLADLLLDLPCDAADAALHDLDAKRLLAAKSSLARELGALLSPARIARCMSRSDLHPDVLHLLERLEAARPALGGRTRERGRRRAGGRRQASSG
jgi:hypothetical protein